MVLVLLISCNTLLSLRKSFEQCVTHINANKSTIAPLSALLGPVPGLLLAVKMEMDLLQTDYYRMSTLMPILLLSYSKTRQFQLSISSHWSVPIPPPSRTLLTPTSLARHKTARQVFGMLLSTPRLQIQTRHLLSSSSHLIRLLLLTQGLSPPSISLARTRTVRLLGTMTSLVPMSASLFSVCQTLTTSLNAPVCFPIS